MGYYGGSFEQLPGARAAHVVLVDANGQPIFGGAGGSGGMGSGGATVSIPADIVSGMLQAGNTARKSLRIVNAANRTLYLSFQPGPNPVVYAEFVPAGQMTMITDCYGPVFGVWHDTGPVPISGRALVTEVV